MNKQIKDEASALLEKFYAKVRNLKISGYERKCIAKRCAVIAAKDTYISKIKFLQLLSCHLNGEYCNEVTKQESEKFKKLIETIENL
jgi:hypothetical protein